MGKVVFPDDWKSKSELHTMTTRTLKGKKANIFYTFTITDLGGGRAKLEVEYDDGTPALVDYELGDFTPDGAESFIRGFMAGGSWFGNITWKARG